MDHSGASDASAGAGAKTGYDVKKVEGTGARWTGASEGKTMAHDDWTMATLKQGSPNLCS